MRRLKMMAVNKYLWIKSRVLYISILLSVYPLATTATDEEDNLSSCIHRVERIERTPRIDEIDMLKKNILIKFNAQRKHREHLLTYPHAASEPLNAIREVKDWMWQDIKNTAKRFFKVYDYESCKFDDVLFVGALFDIYVNQTTQNKDKQAELLFILEDSCKYISYEC